MYIFELTILHEKKEVCGEQEQEDEMGTRTIKFGDGECDKV